jgi:ElaB/YqjD/DUF883 family membrane-anchored ribosome-binding protein
MAETEVIQAQMEETRTRLAENLDKLTRQTSESVQEVTSTVSETVEAVQESVEAVTEAVQGSVAAVTDTVSETVGGVKDFFDLPGHVERHPWLMVGGAAAVGFMACRMLSPPAQSRVALPPPAASPPAPAPVKEPEANLETSPGANRLEGHWPEERSEKKHESKGFFEGLTETYAPLLDKLKSFAIGAAMGVARNVIVPTAGAGIASDIRGMIDDFTKQLGGEPIADVPQANKDQKDNKGNNKNPQRDNAPRERMMS